MGFHVDRYQAAPYSELLAKIYWREDLSFLSSTKKNFNLSHHLFSSQLIAKSFGAKFQLSLGHEFHQDESYEDHRFKIQFDYYL